MVGFDPGGHAKVGEIGFAEQHGLNPQFRNKDLHPRMGIADLQHTGDPHQIPQWGDAPIVG